MTELTTKEAVQHVLTKTGMSKYALAKSLGLAPVSISQYLRNTKMSEQTAHNFYLKYGIIIMDAY